MFRFVISQLIDCNYSDSRMRVGEVVYVVCAQYVRKKKTSSDVSYHFVSLKDLSQPQQPRIFVYCRILAIIFYSENVEAK